MVASDSFAEFLREQLAPLGRVTMRRMFGKTGVFCDGLMFGSARGRERRSCNGASSARAPQGDQAAGARRERQRQAKMVRSTPPLTNFLTNVNRFTHPTHRCVYLR